MQVTTNNNTYNIDGVEYSRVTSIIDIINDPDYRKFRESVSKQKYDEIMKNAAERGTNFHKLVELYVDKKITDTMTKNIKRRDDGLSLPFQTFVKWADKNIDEFICSEQLVVSKKYNYAGTLDLVVRLKGRKRLTIIDLKFIAKVGEKPKLQSSAYSNAYTEQTGNIVGDRLILQFNTKGKVKEHYYRHQATDFIRFVYCLELYKIFN